MSPLAAAFPGALLFVSLFHTATFALYALLPAREIDAYALRADGRATRTRLPRACHRPWPPAPARAALAG